MTLAICSNPLNQYLSQKNKGKIFILPEWLRWSRSCEHAYWVTKMFISSCFIFILVFFFLIYCNHTFLIINYFKHFLKRWVLKHVSFLSCCSYLTTLFVQLKCIVSWIPLFPLLEGPHPGEALTGSVDASVCAWWKWLLITVGWASYWFTDPRISCVCHCWPL